MTDEDPIISPRLLPLVDFMLRKEPYWSIHKYEDQVDESLRKAFVEHVEKSHRDNMDERQGK